jgi:hypothetical protein
VVCVAVICSPNMGIVDSWLPVMAALRRQHPDWRLVAIIPRAWGIGIRPGSAAVRALDGFVDAVYVEILPGEYRVVGGFSEAAGLRMRYVAAAESLSRLEGRLSRRPTYAQRLLRTLVRTAAVFAPGGKRVRWPADGYRWLLLLDAETLVRVGVRNLVRELGDPPSFSLFHGLGYFDPVEESRPARRTPVQRAYAYSEGHRQRLLRDHDLDASVVRVTGVPRHDPDGPSLLAGLTDGVIGEDWDGSVLLISRPSTSGEDRPTTATDWLPAGRKAEQLRALHRVVCEEQGLRLIVTMHPKERDDRSIRQVLPAEDEGRAWMLTESHPLVLAPRLSFAVSFSSSVAIDLLSVGVPTIEFQNVRGASAFDGPDALYDAEGRILRTSERRNGLVLAAEDETDLRAQVRQVLERRDAVLAVLEDAYRARYADPRGAVASIVRDLEAFAAGRAPTTGPSGVDH